jgi:hypothetical protein
MGKVWVLDTETKGTGAQMVPLEKVQAKPEAEPRPERPRERRPRPKSAAGTPVRGKRAARREATSTSLPAGHVRKKGTGEIGRVQSVDSRAGTARVRWLRGGTTSTVPLTAISRH